MSRVLLVLAMIGAGASGARSQTLVTQATSGFTAAQTTTITAVDANGNPTLAGYQSGNMNDVNSSGGNTSDSNSTSSYLMGDGGGSVVNNGVASVKIGTTTYSTGAGDTYARAGFYIDSGDFLSAATTTVSAANAGVAFRLLGNQPANGTTGYYAVGVDLVKVGDVAGVYTGTSSTLGTATVDFFLVAEVTPASGTTLGTAAGKVYVIGTDSSLANSSTATTGWNPTTSTWVQLGSSISAGGNLSNSTVAVTNGATLFVTDGGSTVDDGNQISFGGTYANINSALRTIYGTDTAVQWNTGDTVRFAPLSTVGGTVDFMGINSAQGGTAGLPFASNGTAAITDAYLTGDNFTLTRTSIDGFRFGVVPEPSTWMSAGVLVAVGGGLRWRRWRASRPQEVRP
ncbi:MAG: hypothetical protein HZC55_03105 [Verrucomicrobia bacterium]|nr:hypothetical protein [Verrucomicrobiota bacterium]